MFIFFAFSLCLLSLFGGRKDLGLEGLRVDHSLLLSSPLPHDTNKNIVLEFVLDRNKQILRSRDAQITTEQEKKKVLWDTSDSDGVNRIS